jgi:ketosteroid isomerase-like protein
VEEQKPRFEASRDQREELAHRFFAAAQEGDVAALEALLADDVVLHGDGGGKVPALARALFGRARVARTLSAWFRQREKVPDPEVREVWVNGQPGAILMAAGGVVSVMALDIADGRVQGVRSIVNPDKLSHVGEPADWVALLNGGQTP